MNDRHLERVLRGLDRPAEPDHGFATRLLVEVEREFARQRRGSPWRQRVLVVAGVAAAVVATVVATVVAARLVSSPAPPVVVDPTPTESVQDVGGAAPSARMAAAMAYDRESDVVVMYGGAPRIVDATPNAETWLYTPSEGRWRLVSADSPPGPLSGHVMAYDEESDLIVLFGGSREGFRQDGPGPYTGATWTYDVDRDVWTRMAPEVSPDPMKFQPSFVYDAAADRMVLLGGGAFGSGATTNDLWVYDVDADTWDQRLPGPLPARNAHATAYVPGLARVAVWGGRVPDEPEGAARAVWLYDTTADSWEQLPAADGPPLTWAAALVHDPVSGDLLLVGGAYDDPGVARDATSPTVWSFDPAANRWAERADLGGGVAFHAAAATDSSVVVFGGVEVYDAIDQTRVIELAD